MRWYKTKIGETRIKKKFLLVPRRINNETRWLEFATIEQERVQMVRLSENLIPYPHPAWRNVRFIDELNTYPNKR